MNRAALAAENPVQAAVQRRFDRVIQFVEDRPGSAPFLAGDAFTAADIMSVFTLTTMRLFQPFDLTGRPNIRRYLQRTGERPAYRRALANSDPGHEPLLT